MREPDPVAQRLHGRVVPGAFVPHPLFANAHLQTLLPLLRPTPKVALRIERWELPDGDFVDLGWCEQSRGHGPLPQGPLPHAGHWALRFARTQPGHELFYRYVEGKTALNRPGTINGDQGLLIGAAFLRELSGFDERLPFLEDQRIAAKIFERGRWFRLPGFLTTSARRFETEGAQRRYTLMALIMGLHAAGADEYFARAKEVYATQDATGRLKVSAHLALVRRVLREAGWRRACQILFRAGRCSRQNSWQLFFWCDVALRRPSRPFLRFHDTFLHPLTNNVVFDALGMVLISIWFLLVLPMAYSVVDRIPGWRLRFARRPRG
jgi:hypothetical protein